MNGLIRRNTKDARVFYVDNNSPKHKLFPIIRNKIMIMHDEEGNL